MANISTELAAIMAAVYGRDVRQSIHDAIDKINKVGEVQITAGTAINSASSSSVGFYDGSLYINIATWNLWKCTGTNTWQNLGCFVGMDGEDGNGIESITGPITVGLNDTYTIHFTDGTEKEFTVVNGRNGTDGKDGSQWYKGTALTGTGSSIVGFPGVIHDFYLNSETGMVYTCVKTGGAMVPDAAEWDYVMTMTGGGGGGSITVIDSLNSTSTTDALSANQGRAINNPNITEANERDNIATGDTLPVIFGKIKKFFTDLKDVAFTGAYSDLTDKPDWHSTTATLSNSYTVTFNGLSKNYGYELWVEDTVAFVTNIQKTEASSSTINIVYTVTGTGLVPGTTKFKLRIIQ